MEPLFTDAWILIPDFIKIYFFQTFANERIPGAPVYLKFLCNSLVLPSKRLMHASYWCFSTAMFLCLLYRHLYAPVLWLWLPSGACHPCSNLMTPLPLSLGVGWSSPIPRTVCTSRLHQTLTDLFTRPALHRLQNSESCSSRFPISVSNTPLKQQKIRLQTQRCLGLSN